MAETTRTLVAVDCDPTCKWKQGVNTLAATRDERKDTVPEEIPAGETQPRPTDEGYAELDRIEQDYVGLMVLESLAQNCRRPCVIERYVEANTDRSVGAEVARTINELRGEQ